MIAALFVQPRGCYIGLPGVDPWDAQRDARKYQGPYAVVAHPPCTRWCQLARVVEARYGYAVGEDGGCFASALTSVRAWGGVLEHPALSIAWARFGLARPRANGWIMTPCGGWVCEVSQRAYGHRARKLTWLYYVGDRAPAPLDWSRPEPIATVSYMNNNGGRDVPRIDKREASATPPAFRSALIALAENAMLR